MKTAIRAIETEYAGCRFRSRLEARWAVFFDALGIEWRYEPEGFEFDGRRYLPDFYLPRNKVWVEVKGDPQALDSELMRRAALSLPWAPGGTEPVHSGLQVLLLGEVPEAPTLHSCLTVANTHAGRYVVNQSVAFVAWRHQPGVLLAPIGYGEPLLEGEDLDEMWQDRGIAPGVLVDPSTEFAHRAARSARFEFGESGARI